MGTYNKNISAIIIILCIVCIIIGIFIPHNTNNVNLTQNNFSKSINERNFSFTPKITSSIFKGEKISAIKLDGIISDSQGNSFLKDITSSNYVLESLIKAGKDPSIKAIVLRINSPGGTVAASQEIYRAVIKARKRKPVVITMGDVAASGGYYIASAGDAIFANPGTLTGSIGVITSYLNFYDLLNKIGIKGVVIKSGEYKDLGNPTRPLSEEERKILQTLLDETYSQFISDVAAGRNMSKQKIAAIAKGLIYTGSQAKKIGLVDYLGDYNKAVKYAQQLAKERFPELIRKYGKADIPLEETWKETSLLDALLGAYNKSINPQIVESRILKSFVHSKYQPLWLLE